MNGIENSEPHGTKVIDYAIHKTIALDNVTYTYLEAGSGKTIFLLHGYPDNAYSWEHQIKVLSKQGYRVIVPFLRGYAPTVTTDYKPYFDRATLACDISNLIDKLNDGKAVYLVGQDWGAAISYGLLATFPEKVSRAMILAVPHPIEINRTLKRSPRHIVRSFHWFLFQLPWLPEIIIRANNGRFLKFLWRLWSPNFNDDKHVDHIIKSMLTGTGVEDTLAYYRAVTQKKYRDPALISTFQQLNNKISVPTRVLCGSKDMRKEMLPRQKDLFNEKANYQFALIEGAGHFLHRERSQTVTEEIKNWLPID